MHRLTPGSIAYSTQKWERSAINSRRTRIRKKKRAKKHQALSRRSHFKY